jgi:diguanylate cyclase (GGDEF)-like protein
LSRSVATRLVAYLPAWVWSAGGALAFTALLLAAAAGRERRRRHDAEREALADALTGVANRKGFEQRLDHEWRRSRRYGRPLGLLLIDLDGFKQVNDRHGHAAGDRVLRDVAAGMAARVRDADLVARIGGDEFAVICPESDASGLELLSQALARQAATVTDPPVGMSVGIAELDPEDVAPSDLVDRADRSMYRRKAVNGGSTV